MKRGALAMAMNIVLHPQPSKRIPESDAHWIVATRTIGPTWSYKECKKAGDQLQQVRQVTGIHQDTLVFFLYNYHVPVVLMTKQDWGRLLESLQVDFPHALFDEYVRL